MGTYSLFYKCIAIPKRFHDFFYDQIDGQESGWADDCIQMLVVIIMLFYQAIGILLLV